MSKNIIKNSNFSKHDIQEYNFLKDSGDMQENNNMETNDKINSEENNANTEVISSANNVIYETILQRTEEVSKNLAKAQEEFSSREEEYERKLKEVEDRAYANGKADALNEQNSRREEEHKELLELYKRTILKIEELDNKFKEDLNSLEQELSSVAINIANKVIDKEVSLDSASIAYNLAKNLISEIKNASNITIKLSPKDYISLSDSFKDINEVEITEDTSIKDGGVIINSNLGTIDGTIFSRYNKFIKDINGEK